MDKQTRINIWYLLATLLLIWSLQPLLHGFRAVETIPYSTFERHLEAGEIADVVVTSERIEGRYANPRPTGPSHFVTNRVPTDIAERLREAGVEFSGRPENDVLTTVLSWIVPALVFFAVWFLAVRNLAERQGLGGLMSLGKSGAKIYVEQDTGTTFADVAGADEAKAELEEIVEFLKNPEGYRRLGASMPKGVLLVGPPGTGKTLIARAVAGEAAVPFFSISGSEFVEMFVGIGAARVRDLFEQTRQRAPAIVFIDELDALGRARGAGLPGGNDEREQTLNQLLVELDGFDTREGLVLIAATNRPEILDPALLRAGRFDRQVLVDRPDKHGRAAILRVHMRKIQVDVDVDAEAVAALTTGFTGADLANLVNEAALLATREGADAVRMTHFTRAIERIIAGLEKKNRLINPEERRAVAYHEMGHALVSLLLPGVDRAHKVSIIPRGVGALGYTMQRPTEDRFLMRQQELENKIAVLLGGRAAEALVFETLSTGAADDLAKATDVARSMVTRYGMDERLGHVSYDEPVSPFLGEPHPPRQRPFSESTAREIDEAVRRLIDAQFRRAYELLETNRDVLEEGAATLLRQETLEESELKALAERLHRPVPAGTAASLADGAGTAA